MAPFFSLYYKREVILLTLKLQVEMFVLEGSCSDPPCAHAQGGSEITKSC